MKCIILAAGYATRLYPLTLTVPKPLLPVKGKPILDWLIEDLERTGKVSEYIVVSNHRFIDAFRNWAGGKHCAVRVLDDGSTENDNRLGAVRDIVFALENGGLGEDVLVAAGDNLLSFSLGCFLEYGAARQACCMMRYEEPSIERLKKCGVITVDESDRVTGMVEKPPVPPSHWCCPAFYYFPKDALALIPRAIESGCGVDAPGSLLAWMREHVAVYAMRMPGRRFDIGTPETYQEVQEQFVPLF